MSFRDGLLPILDDIQEIAGPAGLDVRTNQVFVVQRTYTHGDELGGYTDVEVEIEPRPQVRERNRGRELVVKPVHQKYVDVVVGGNLRSGGFDAEVLNPEDAVNVEILFRVAGPNVGEYTLVDFSASRPFRNVLVLKRVPDTDGRRLAHPQPYHLE